MLTGKYMFVLRIVDMSYNLHFSISFCKFCVYVDLMMFCKQVLGAAMFYIKVGDNSVVYTGDYNMTPDRHLGAAQIDRLCPDLLITE